ncbi:MAG: protoheme IX farnesyltransferase [Armatimonadetes bacterium]|nr:protoheme IX farnesyltransferase [Armatimonadota bacterium]
MVPVILWGAFVRASFSGDGCGNHWPDCHGTLLPKGAPLQTWFEYFHRVSSGIIGPLIVALLVLCFRAAPKGTQLRKAAFATLFFTITESAVGAKLVLKGWVATDPSVQRAVWMGIHLTNTFMLLGSLALVVWLSSGRRPIRMTGQGALGWAISFGAILTVLMGITGAVAALGNMLYPSESLIRGLQDDLNPASHFLVRLRAAHPLTATSVGVFLLFLMNYLSKARQSAALGKYAKVVIGLYAFQMGFGVLNLVMKAPIWMQLGHLLIADVLWVALLWAFYQALSDPIPVGVTAGEAVAEIPKHTNVTAASPTEAAVPLWKAYIALTKPRVISLLLFTTYAAAFIAARGWPGGWLMLALTIGGYFAAGAANAINMVYDRDIDIRMARTATRPTVTQQIPSSHALIFAFVLEAISFAVLTSVANLLTAVLALAGLLFYVLVYTMALKRRTWHNIVIGGAAGAFPPLVGYAGVTGVLSPLAWVLFGIIFLWTPVHFWALALLIKDDYRDAGIPMLPVVRGERATVVQIMLYTILTVAVSVLPLFQGEAGIPYLIGAVILNAVLFVRTYQLYVRPERTEARVLFKYSMVYLALLFLMIAVDRARIF